MTGYYTFDMVQHSRFRFTELGSRINSLCVIYLSSLSRDLHAAIAELEKIRKILRHPAKIDPGVAPLQRAAAHLQGWIYLYLIEILSLSWLLQGIT